MRIVVLLFAGYIQCRHCRQYLRPGLYELDTLRCNACVRKTKFFATRSRGFQRSVNNTFVTRRVPANVTDIDPATYLQSIRREISDTLLNGLELHGAIRWVLSLTVVFERLFEGDEEQIIRADFTGGPAQILLRPDQIDEQIDLAIAIILERIEAFIALGSDWTIRQIDCHFLKFAR